MLIILFALALLIGGYSMCRSQFGPDALITSILLFVVVVSMCGISGALIGGLTFKPSGEDAGSAVLLASVSSAALGWLCNLPFVKKSLTKKRGVSGVEGGK